MDICRPPNVPKFTDLQFMRLPWGKFHAPGKERVLMRAASFYGIIMQIQRGKTRMKWKDSFHPYAMTTILFWSMAYVLTRLALRSFSAFSLGFLRYAFASLAMLALARLTRMKRPRKADLKWFLLAGAVGFFLYMIAFNKGCETVTAATGSVVIATVPVITALLARALFGERLRVYQWTAIGIEFAGVVILTLLKGAFSVNRGLLWLIFAAFLLSVYNLLQRKLTRSYTGLQASAYSIFAGTILLCAFAPSAVREAGSAPPVHILYCALLGVFSSAVAYYAWAQAFKKAAKASSVSNYMFLTPFLTSLLGFVIAGGAPGYADDLGRRGHPGGRSAV